MARCLIALHLVEPHTAHSAQSDSRRPRKWLVVLLLLTGAYGVSYLVWFLGTPLGSVPVLDGRENLILARQISEGTLPAEPFFRAMLYPAVISVAAAQFPDDSDLLLFVGALGVFFHLVTTAAVFACARLVWRHVAPAFVAGLLFGLYPPAVYFAAEPLDTTLSLGLLALGVYIAIAAVTRLKSDPRMSAVAAVSFIAAGALLALAFTARPNFLPVLIALPIALLWLSGPWRRGALTVLLAVVGIAPVLVAYGAWQQSICGQFGVMPWQGGFSLWVANGPDANGRYYAQKTAIAYEGAHQNPARIESEALFRAETKANPSPAKVDRFWREKTKAAILADPGRWAGLELKKLYFFLNDFEQYNNKTFSFHRALSPFLKWNPLSWGLIFSLAVAGLFALPRANRPISFGLLFLAAFYFTGCLLVFAGDRFRFPLAPFAAIFAGGTGLIATELRREWPISRRLACVAAVLAALALTFSRYAGVYDTSTYVQDRVLLANASLRAGDDTVAQAFATEVLEQHPDRADARHIAAAARFNQHVSGTAPIQNEQAWQQIEKDLDDASKTLPRMSWMRAVAAWNGGHHDVALTAWRQLADAGGSRAHTDALAMLVLSGSATAAERQRMLQLDWKQASPYAWAARSSLEGPGFDQQIESAVSPSDWAKTKDTVSRLLKPTKR